MNEMKAHGLGWIPDLPDFRDYTEETRDIRAILAPTGVMFAPADGKRRPRLAASVDLRPWASPVEDQGALGSCTAQAGAGIIEYYERKSFGHHVESSRLFLYKATRNLMKSKGDSGAYLRMTMGAMVIRPCMERFSRDEMSLTSCMASSYGTPLFVFSPLILTSIKIFVARSAAPALLSSSTAKSILPTEWIISKSFTAYLALLLWR